MQVIAGRISQPEDAARESYLPALDNPPWIADNRTRFNPRLVYPCSLPLTYVAMPSLQDKETIHATIHSPVLVDPLFNRDGR